ncbi:DUF1707 domain-containing protein [Corynebacterium variabile]|uniref:DUF1707 domain-containing protein n=2 Tax=Corynebacterium variabile TaxID=1727 RepID=A0A4Y4BWA0_9CORY|nr:DUF1707 domain-containing protein [Corynebacterium variabile]GEC85121.1 hypothetical protein CVA01_04350 [Corynebacterium variabile]
MDNPYAAHLRATDLDRTKVASVIDRAYAEGQLNSLEHDERVSAAMTAATRGDLLELIKDLQVERPEFSAPEKKANPLIPSQNPATGLIVVIVAVVTLVVVAAVVMLVGRSGSDSPDPAPATPAVSETPAEVSEDQPAESESAVSTAVPAEDAGGTGEEPGDTTPKISVYEMETTIRGDYLNDRGHIPEYVTCPDALDVELGAAVECSVGDHGALFPATVTVIGVDLPNVTYNVSITGVW